jgi:hypothetical protein
MLLGRYNAMFALLCATANIFKCDGEKFCRQYMTFLALRVGCRKQMFSGKMPKECVLGPREIFAMATCE